MNNKTTTIFLFFLLFIIGRYLALLIPAPKILGELNPNPEIPAQNGDTLTIIPDEGGIDKNAKGKRYLVLNRKGLNGDSVLLKSTLSHEVVHAIKAYGGYKHDIPMASAEGYLTEYIIRKDIKDISVRKYFYEGLNIAKKDEDIKIMHVSPYIAAIVNDMLLKYHNVKGEPIESYYDGAKLAGIAYGICYNQNNKNDTLPFRYLQILCYGGNHYHAWILKENNGTTLLHSVFEPNNPRYKDVLIKVGEAHRPYFFGALTDLLLKEWSVSKYSYSELTMHYPSVLFFNAINNLYQNNYDVADSLFYLCLLNETRENDAFIKKFKMVSDYQLYYSAFLFYANTMFKKYPDLEKAKSIYLQKIDNISKNNPYFCEYIKNNQWLIKAVKDVKPGTMSLQSIVY